MIRRPFCLVAGSYAGGIWAAYLLREMRLWQEVCIIAIIIAAVCGIYVCLTRKTDAAVHAREGRLGKDRDAAAHAREERIGKEGYAAAHARGGRLGKERDAATHASQGRLGKERDAAAHTSQGRLGKERDAAAHASQGRLEKERDAAAHAREGRLGKERDAAAHAREERLGKERDAAAHASQGRLESGRSLGKRILLGCVAAFVLGGILCHMELSKRDPLEKYASSNYLNTGKPADFADAGGEKVPLLQGRVLSGKKGDRDALRLVVESGGRKLLLSVRCKGEVLTVQQLIGRNIEFEGAVEIPEGKANPNCFDYRKYLLSQGIRIIVRCDSSQLRVKERDAFAKLVGAFAMLKYGMAERLGEHMSRENLALVMGIIFGMNDEMDEETMTMFRENGIYHILCVSGMHVAILYGALCALFRRRKRTAVCVATLAVLFCYAALCDFSETVMRAFIMIGFHLIANLTKRRYDFLTAVCAAATILLIFNPLSLLSPGFRLSFLAAMIITFVLPYISRLTGIRMISNGMAISEREARRAGRFVPYRLSKVGDALVAAVAIPSALSPLTAYLFNVVTPVGVLLNLPAAIIAGIIIPLGMVSLVISVLPSPDILIGILANSMELLAKLLLAATEMAESLPLAHCAAASPPLVLVLAFFAALFACVSETFRLLVSRKKFGVIIIVSISLVAMVCLSGLTLDGRHGGGGLTFVDVGQGDCLHVRTPDGKNYLVDGGGSTDYNVGRKVLYEYLMKNGVSRLDGVFITHLHTDHAKGIAELSGLMPIGDVFLSEAYRGRESEFTDECGAGVAQIVFLAAGDSVQLGGASSQVCASVLYPGRDEAKRLAEEGRGKAAGEIDENKASLMLSLDYEGVKTLMTGDMGTDAEAAVIARGETDLLRSDILKVGHHGSKYSTSDEFLSAVKPRYAVIQNGRNTFGHPTRETLEKLLASGIIVQRNDISGAVMFNIERGRITDYGTCGKTEYITEL